MSSLTALIKSQLGFMSLINKAYETFKKSPQDKLRKESYLVTRIELLEDKWKVFADTHMKLSAVEEIDETKYMKENVYQAVEELYIDYKSDMREALSLLKPTAHSNSHMVESNVRLPKISIPTFSGSYAEWTTFRDLYVSLIHNNSSIDEVQKMHYLKGHLSGEAEQLLRHVSISAANYEEAWSTLSSRYNNKKYLANCLLRRFMNQPNINKESSSAIKDLLDVMNETLHGLKNLGVNVSTWDTIVIYTISSKMDSESRREWEFKISACDELPTLNQLREFMEARFRSLEFLDSQEMSKSNSSVQSNKVFHAMSISSDANQSNCPYCKEHDHKISNCKDFCKIDYDQRHNFVRMNNLCFNCLGMNHSAYMCQTASRCHICKHKHHSLLHPDQSTTSQLLILAKPDLEVELKSANDESDDKLTSRVSAHYSQKQGKNNQVLLATAVVGAQADGCVRLLRALVDQGSQTSFVTESAVRMLGLPVIPNKTSITGLGGDKSSLASKYFVEMNIQSCYDPNFQLKVRANVLNEVTSFLPTEKIEYVEWPELANLGLADPQFHTPSKIDLLLGADVYGQILREGLIRGPKGTPMAQRTALGWILSGPTHNNMDEGTDKQHCHHNVLNLHSRIKELQKPEQVEAAFFNDKKYKEEGQHCKEFYGQTIHRKDMMQSTFPKQGNKGYESMMCQNIESRRDIKKKKRRKIKILQKLGKSWLTETNEKPPDKLFKES